MRPIGIDLFAGAGGLSLGFEQAGFDVAAAVDIDPVHCAVHKFNFPYTAIIPRDVEGLSAKTIRVSAGLADREVDCVFGGPPCQGFSLIGHRALEDLRNNLVFQFVRIVAELNAKTFVFENVKGLTVGRHKSFIYELVEAFDKAGYNTRLPWKVLNAAHYSTPQSRERLILLGARKGEQLPAYPDALTNAANKQQRIDGLPSGPTCAQAIGDLPEADRFATLIRSDEVQTTAFGQPSLYAAELRCMTNNAWHFSYVRDWNPAILTSSARTAHTDISRRRFRETEPGTTEPISRLFKLPADGVSNTLRAGTDGARGAFTSPRPIHYSRARCITVREMARLHGFPDWFRFNVTKWHGGRQIGNAVTPPLAWAIAGAVRDALGVTVRSPEQVLTLSDTKLLGLDMSQAAKFFGIESPSGRRDRKSGVKKRKQIEIEEERLVAQVANA